MGQFVSGPWRGFYTYNAIGDRGRMDLDLTFKEGIVTGSGTDPVGFFTIRGRFEESNDEIWWTKTYAGRHDVFYKGFREARFIWGTWEISPGWTGGFKIWPKGMGEEAEEEVAEEVPVTSGLTPGKRGVK